eukprot:gene24083-30386_t
MWLGGEGVLATAHYDTVNNVYIQLSGSKRFRLLPPSSLRLVGLHGRHHPYACQSRIADLSTGKGFTNRKELSVLGDHITQRDSTQNSDHTCVSIDTNDDITSASISVPPGYTSSLIEVVLHPGDILLIPPFWLHEAAALSCSTSVSHWWDANQMVAMDDIYSLPLPLESNWSPLVTLSAVITFSSRLVRGFNFKRGGGRGRGVTYTTK